MSLLVKTSRNIGYMAAVNFFGTVINTITLLVLARILDSPEFGLLALGIVVLYGLEHVSDLGMNSALIQKQDGADRSISTGFWDYPIGGIGVPSHKWMTELLEAQKAGKEPDEPSLLRLDAGKLDKEYPEDIFPGHAAWLDWPWKLHRIETKKGVKLELYNLAEDPQEKNDLAAQKADRVNAMKGELERWLKSVVRSLNGEDY